ncbi:hypothetical protein CVU75_03065 [Candidatus Dependentiae bacterium HGW-Dependentiae-1]|nr:MAG: hypothetical protein CVU75_03065 [Candidatus Dependentiae bacterium HGW-Dependentiae-1]
MKSLMEEASSIAKALEKAWARAGNPREFTVKVLDKPEKNFFGFTTKSAKVAILFEEEVAPRTQHTSSRYQERPQNQPRQQQKPSASQAQGQQKKIERAPERAPERTRRPQQEHSTATNNSTQQQSGSQPATPQAPKRVHEPVWTPERIAFVRQWIENMQKAMNRTDISCDISTDRNAIRIIFQKPLLEDIEQEKQLFRSWAYLIMQTLRHTYKQHFKHIKIILKSTV